MLITRDYRQFPLCVLELLKMESCCYAIKFGDFLTLEDCRLLIGQLEQCQSPFICAHGRPSLMPLVRVEIPDDHQSVYKDYEFE